MSVSIRLMIFSGRPDPRFDLPEDVIEGLATRVTQTIGVDMVPAPPDIALGYRGVEVENVGGHAGLPSEFSVFRGVLTEQSGETARHWRDAGAVEQFLLDQARNSGLGDLLAAAGLDGGVA